MPPAYVKAYVHRQKNAAADAAAICEAMTRPSMRFVPVRSVENQATLMHHRVRELLVTQRTQLLNALRSHLAEIGIPGIEQRTRLGYPPHRGQRHHPGGRAFGTVAVAVAIANKLARIVFAPMRDVTHYAGAPA